MNKPIEPYCIGDVSMVSAENDWVKVSFYLKANDLLGWLKERGILEGQTDCSQKATSGDGKA